MINDYLHKTLTIYIVVLLIINFTYSKYENNVYYFNVPSLCEFTINSNMFLILPLLIYIYLINNK
jgi:polyferredoxin